MKREERELLPPEDAVDEVRAQYFKILMILQKDEVSLPTSERNSIADAQIMSDRDAADAAACADVLVGSCCTAAAWS